MKKTEEKSKFDKLKNLLGIGGGGAGAGGGGGGRKASGLSSPGAPVTARQFVFTKELIEVHLHFSCLESLTNENV